MARTCDAGRQRGVTGMEPSDTTSPARRRSSQTVTDDVPAADDVDVLQLDASDAAFIELTDRVLAKARAVQQDPKRRRPRLR